MLPLPSGSLYLSVDFLRNLERFANMGKDAAVIRSEFHARLCQIARDLTGELYPQGLPRGTKFSELETVAGALGDEMARQLIEINVQEQADDWPEEELGECPLCGGAARKAPDQPRVLTDHAGRRRLETTRRQLPPLSAGFFSLRIKRWALTIRASAHACNRRSSTLASTVFLFSRLRGIWPNCLT